MKYTLKMNKNKLICDINMHRKEVHDGNVKWITSCRVIWCKWSPISCK